ncbi:TPA: YjgN family protein [Klebsiella oxytoca]
MHAIAEPQRFNRQHFIFHGQGQSYFILCLVNVILSVMTLGIFIPWAWVRNRRYLAENLELSGARFAYHARGSAILFSFAMFLAMLAVVFCIFNFCTAEATEAAALTLLLFMFLSPLMAMQGLSFHASMTTLNGVPFGFQCSSLRAWWVLSGMPLLMVVLMFVLFSSIGTGFWGYGYRAILLQAVLLELVQFIGMSVILGILYSHWLELIGKGASFGIYKFDINASSKRCIIISLWAMLIQVPFFLLSTAIAAIFIDLSGLFLEPSEESSLFSGGWVMLISLVIFWMGVVCSAAYAWVSLRNHAINNLTLDNRIQFHSTLTFSAIALRLLALIFLSALTLGLAWPWLKINLLRYLAVNTQITGDLDALTLNPGLTMPAPTTLGQMCSSFIPMLPFL